MLWKRLRTLPTRVVSDESPTTTARLRSIKSRSRVIAKEWSQTLQIETLCYVRPASPHFAPFPQATAIPATTSAIRHRDVCKYCTNRGFYSQMCAKTSESLDMRNIYIETYWPFHSALNDCRHDAFIQVLSPSNVFPDLPNHLKRNLGRVSV